MSTFPPSAQPPESPPVQGGLASRPDPGSRTAAKIAWVLVAVLMGVLVAGNQIPGCQRGKTTVVEKALEEKEAPTHKEIEPPDPADKGTLTAKLTAAWNQISPMKSDADAALDTLPTATDEDRIRTAIIAADISGPKAALQRLEALIDKPDLNPALAEDAATLRTAYEGPGRVTDADDVARLVKHHGWFGKLAATHGLDASDPQRKELFAFLPRLVGAFVLLGLIVVVGAVGGITALIILLIRTSQGQVRPVFTPPSPGGSVYLETLPFFVAGFLLLHLVLERVPAAWGLPPWAPLAAQWALIVLPLYPVLFRGVSWAQFRQDVGLHSGRGFWREVGSGLFAYLALLPVLAVAMGLTLVLIVLKALVEHALTGAESPAPSNPIAEVIAGATPGVMIALFLLATLWAPLVEETMFRGCIFRHLRSRMPMLLAAGVSALLFGLMHSYGLILLGPVITLGFGFALMREWRGSMIASMVVHGLHNGIVLTLAFLVLGALKG